MLMRRTIVLGAFLLHAGCGGGAAAPDAGPPNDAGAPDATPDPTAALFDPEHVVEVQIDLAPADWEALRHQANDPLALLAGDCLAGPKVTNFTWFHGDVTVDGTTIQDVGVRKKGFLGSLSISKPSLKIKLDEWVAGQELAGLERLTLNNSRQDPSLIRTCLAYTVFARAGVPAPRCNFAHVTVNGEDLGIYAHVESVDKAMLARNFGSPDGNLYEGQLSDFRAEMLATYEKKTNELDPDRSDLEALAAALTVPDDALLAALEPVLDVEAFFTFWAVEALIAHWDGYASNTNNHFVYHDPASDRLYLMPWGTDMTFVDEDPFRSPERPTSVSAGAVLPYRLWTLPAVRTRYVERMDELLGGAWDDAALTAEVDRIATLIGPYVDDVDGSFAAGVAALRGWVAGRRAAIQGELAGGPPAWPYPLDVPSCMAVAGTVGGTFMTTFGTIDDPNPFATGSGSMALDVPAIVQGTGDPVVSAAGPDAQGGLGRRHAVQLVGFVGGDAWVIYVMVPPELFVAGNELPFDWQSAFGIFGQVDLATESFTPYGTLNGGSIRFDAAAGTEGAPVTGTITADLLTDAP